MHVCASNITCCSLQSLESIPLLYHGHRSTSGMLVVAYGKTELCMAVQFSVTQLPLSVMALGLYIRVSHCTPWTRPPQAAPSQPFCSAPIVLAATIVLVEVTAGYCMPIPAKSKPPQCDCKTSVLFPSPDCTPLSHALHIMMLQLCDKDDLTA